MADYNNRVIYPDEVEKVKKEAARKRRQIQAETDYNAIYYPDEFDESRPKEVPEKEVPEAEALEEEAPEKEAPEEGAIQEKAKETVRVENKASNSDAVVFPDEEYEENI